jgi:hypothetical protein
MFYSIQFSKITYDLMLKILLIIKRTIGVLVNFSEKSFHRNILPEPHLTETQIDRTPFARIPLRRVILRQKVLRSNDSSPDNSSLQLFFC